MAKREPFVIDEKGCWIWTGARGDAGKRPYIRQPKRYGGRVVPAYRYLYERLVGPIPEGLQLDHKCFTPLCVNPEHLEPVTAAENKRRESEHILAGL